MRQSNRRVNCVKSAKLKMISNYKHTYLHLHILRIRVTRKGTECEKDKGTHALIHGGDPQVE